MPLKDKEKLKKYNSISEALRECHIQISGISKCCLEILKTSGKFKWRFNYE